MKREQKWRIQIDQARGARTIVESQVGIDQVYASGLVVPHAELDEVVIDRWFHLEMMDSHQYWMQIGNLTVNVTVGSDGYAKNVMWEEDQ